MSQPTPYTRKYSATSHSTNYPTTPQPGVSLDAEFNAVKATLDQTLTNLALIQRDDGELANQSVGKDALSAAVLAMLVATGVPQGEWATATSYAAKDLVDKDGITYIAVTAHTSGTFSTDLAADKWLALTGSTPAADTIVDAMVRSSAGIVSTKLKHDPDIGNTTRDLNDKIEELGISITDFGAGTSALAAVNDAALDAAYAAAVAAGNVGKIHIPGGNFKFAATHTFDESDILIETDPATEIDYSDATGLSYGFKFVGDRGSIINLSTRPAVGATTLDFSSAHGMVAGDVGYIATNSLLSTLPGDERRSVLGGPAGQEDNTLGEFFTVDTVTDTDTVETAGGLWLPYDLGTNTAFVVKANMIQNAGITGGGKIIAPTAGWNDAILFEWVRNPVLDGITIQMRDSSGVAVSNCWGGVLRPRLLYSDNGASVLGIHLVNGTVGTVVDGGDFWYMKHATDVTFGSTGNSLTGPCRNVSFVNLFAHFTNSTAFTTHWGYDGAQWVNCVTEKCLGSIEIRGRNSTVIGGSLLGVDTTGGASSYGIAVYVGGGYARDTRIMGTSIKQVDRGVWLVDANAPSAWQTSTSYTKGNRVLESSTVYYCIVDHTSGTFATDLAASRWQAADDDDEYVADLDIMGVNFMGVGDCIIGAGFGATVYSGLRIMDCRGRDFDRAINITAPWGGIKTDRNEWKGPAATGGYVFTGAVDNIQIGRDTFVDLGTSKAPITTGATATNVFVDPHVQLLGTNGAMAVDDAGLVAAPKGAEPVLITMADDSAHSFVPPGTIGAMRLTANSDDILTFDFWYRVGASALIDSPTPLEPTVEVTTGALAGTTGNDVHFTFSAHTDGKVYFENRLGGSVDIYIFDLGAVA